jgi:hypothetical protein
MYVDGHRRIHFLRSLATTAQSHMLCFQSSHPLAEASKTGVQLVSWANESCDIFFAFHNNSPWQSLRNRSRWHSIYGSAPQRETFAVAPQGHRGHCSTAPLPMIELGSGSAVSSPRLRSGMLELCTHPAPQCVTAITAHHSAAGRVNFPCFYVRQICSI